MRSKFWLWVGLVCFVVILLAVIAIRRPLLDRIQGRSTPSAPLGVAPQPNKVRLTPVASGFSEPVDIQFVPGREGLAIVLEKGGRARLLEVPRPALPAGPPVPAAAALAAPGAEVLRVDVHARSELGLLGLAFHPKYLDNGLFYLDDNPKDDGPLRTRISEWRVKPEALGTSPAELTRVLLEIDQPYPNHDGGQLAFGPDGYLYIGMGDGGSRNDPQGHGQNLSTLLGAILRIDVDAAPGYGIPEDNPFAGREGVRPEIWAYGLRNPWRFSFDPKGRLIAADVGQDLYEEVDIVAAGDNLGWAVREAGHCFSPRENCPTENLVDPIFEYGRSDGSSITGGHVYLGERLPELRGKYVVADYVTGQLWALELPDDRTERARAEKLGRFPHAISAFGRDAQGELYAADLSGGTILRLDPAS